MDHKELAAKWMLVLSRSENQYLLAYLASLPPPADKHNAVQEPMDFSPIGAGIRPDVVENFWNETALEVPADCQFVIYQVPVLVHPITGIIFGFVSGTPSYALRLPPIELSEAIASGCKTVWTFNDAWMRNLGREHNTVLNLATIGPEWVFGAWRQEEPRWCGAAYRFAAKS